MKLQLLDKLRGNLLGWVAGTRSVQSAELKNPPRIFIICLICFKPDLPNYQYVEIFSIPACSAASALESAYAKVREKLGDEIEIRSYQIGEVAFEAIEMVYLATKERRNA